MTGTQWKRCDRQKDGRMDGQTRRTDGQKEVFLELLGHSYKYEAMIDKNEEYI